MFYVTFWELDQDHDKLINLIDLERYAGGALSKLALQRAFDLLISIRKKQPHIYASVYEERIGKKPTPDELSAFLASN